MGRRCRHLNPRDMGMTGVFDARRITGVANNAAISSWPNLANASNSATQGNGSLQPVFIEQAVNGQPAARFSSDSLETSSSLFSGTGSKVLICVYKSTATGSFVNPIAGQSQGTSTGTWFVMHARTLFATGDPYIAGYAQDTANIVTSPDQLWKVAGGYFDAGSLYTRKAGVTIDTRTGYSMNTVNVAFSLGKDADSFYLAGDIAAVAAGGVSIGFSGLKRLESSFAFSFKLSIN
jgi:hypothetical protein